MGCAVERCSGWRIFSHLLQRNLHGEGRAEKALEQCIVQLARDSRALKTPLVATIEVLALLSVKPTKPSLNDFRCTQDWIYVPSDFAKPRTSDMLD